MYYLIYKTTNIINGKYYIGKHKTQDLDDGYLGSGKLLKRAIEKYGIQNFIKEILLECSSEKEMDLAEKILVVPDSTNYNLCEGGKGGWSYVNNKGLQISGGIKGGYIGGKIYSEKLKNDKVFYDRICEINKNKIQNVWNNISDIEKNKRLYNFKYSFLGRKHSEKTKKKLSLVHQGKHQGSKNSQYGTMWITNGVQNKKIPKNDLDKWLSQGYTKGRKMNFISMDAK